MAGLSFTEFLDNLYTSTWQNRQEGVADNIFNSTPFWFWLKEKGKLKPVRGGRFIEENLVFATNPNIQWITRGGTVPLNDFQFLTVAQFQWRYLTASIVRFGIDDQQNAGKNQVMSLMESKMSTTEESLISEMEVRLAQGSGASVNQIDGLQFMVPDDPTAANFAAGGIDGSQAQFAWWRNQVIDFNGLSFAAQGIRKMRTMLNNCMNNRRMDRTDIILTDQTEYEFYEDAVLSYYRVNNTKLADAGFENQTWKGIPMVWSPQISARMYFLNTNFINFVYDPAYNFDMTEWKPIPDQVNDRAAQIILAGQMTTNRRRVQGVIKNMGTP